MDNSGAAKGETNSPAIENSFKGGVVDNFGALNAGERLIVAPEAQERPAFEVDTSTGAEKNEAVSEAMPMMAPPVAQKKQDDQTDDTQTATDNPELQALIDTPVPRDAEKLPKVYIDNVVKIINKNKKNPHQLVADLDVARWDLMRKAFNRNRGDGK